MPVRQAPAKINLALVVGPTRPDGKHEVVTLYQRISLADEVSLELAPAGAASGVEVEGFPDDTLVTRAVEAVAAAALRAGATVPTGWRARIEKRIPVAAGLGGGSTDAAAALLLANGLLGGVVPDVEIQRIAAALGADVPFFLESQPCLGSGEGSELAPVVGLPLDYAILLLRPVGVVKPSTGAIYAAFDERAGARGWESRRDVLQAALAAVRAPADLAALPANDLASSPLAQQLRDAGAFRADVTGAGPLLYGLFADDMAAAAAALALAPLGETWLCRPTC